MSASPIDAEPRRKAKGPVSPGLLKELRDCADALDKALGLRIGQMDSLSRIDSVIREQRAIIEQVSRRLRDLA